MPISTNLTIRRSFRLSTSAEWNNARAKALSITARDIRDKARELSKRRTSDFSPGAKSNKLAKSIKVSQLDISKSGKSATIKVYADPAETMTDAGPYSSFQESGTGMQSEGRGSTRHFIFPKRYRYMKWRSYHRGYASATVRVLRVDISDIERKEGKAKAYYNFAWRTSGVLPKWYMRDAGRDKTIRANYRKTIKGIVILAVLHKDSSQKVSIGQVRRVRSERITRLR